MKATGNEDYATGRCQRAPDSPHSSDSEDSGAQLEEPFFSTLSYILEQQHRLDDSISSGSNSSPFRCAPRHQESGDEDPSTSLNSQRPTRLSRQSELASRLLFEPFEDEREVVEARRPETTNTGLFGFLSAGTSTSSNQDDMWKNHSERSIRSSVDQSINLMDAEKAVYSYTPPTSAVKAHAQALKQPFLFLLPQNTTDIAKTPEVKPFVDIDLETNAHRYSVHATSLSRKKLHYRRSILVLILGLVLAAVVTWLVTIAVPKHGPKLLEDETVEAVSEADVNFSLEEAELTSGASQAPMTGEGEFLDVKAAKIMKSSGINEAGSGDATLLDPSVVDQSGNRTNVIQYFLEQMGITSPGRLQDTSSPAYLALQWISEEDPAELVVPGFNITPSEHDWLLLEEIFQRYALAVFYFEMKTDVRPDEAEASKEEQNNRLNLDLKWTLKESVCEWPGVKCESYKVVALNLTHSILQGTLPPEILDGIALPCLTSLDLSHNHIRGPLPDVPPTRRLLMSKPSTHALKHLQLSHNRITGNLQNLAHYNNLTFVDLSYNGLTGEIPDHGLVPLSDLDYLSLYHNSLQGEIPSSLGSLENLKTLFLDDNRLQGTVPMSLGDLLQLESLRLLGNQLTGSVPNSVCQLQTKGKLSFLMADCSTGQFTCDCCTRCWRD